jgi:hypothetical protein
MIRRLGAIHSTLASSERRGLRLACLGLLSFGLSTLSINVNQRSSAVQMIFDSLPGPPRSIRLRKILVAPNLFLLPVRCGFLLKECIPLATAINRQTGE